jgi:hypothetical protein
MYRPVRLPRPHPRSRRPNPDGRLRLRRRQPGSFSDPTGLTRWCDTSGDCTAAGPGNTTDNTISTTSTSSSEGGDGYTDLGPGVKVQDNDPKLAATRNGLSCRCEDVRSSAICR